MPGWEDEPLGAFGSASQIPSNEWFPVNTATGQWGTPTPTLASAAGVPDVGPSAVPTMGAPDVAPTSIGQVAGTMAPPMTMPRSMQRVQRLDEMGALTRQPGMWETIARGIGNLSPQGRAILQSSDQQQQQQLQNRLVMRRQALQEEQNERAEIRDDFQSLLKLSEIKSKKLRGLYTDRFIADMQARGKTLPPDFVEAFKSSGGEEAKAMVKFYEPLLTDLGLDPTAFAALVDQGGIKEVGEALTLAQKLKKDKTEQVRLDALDKIDRGDSGTLGDASGTTAPVPGAPTPGPAPGTPTTAPTPGTRQPLAAPSKDISAAIDESTRLYPQVRKELLTSIAASESNFDPTVTSPKGAQGVMQLMPGTAKELGVTDPFNVQQNVRGGTRYFAQQLAKYKGNEALALAAYNWGPGNVDKVGGDLSKMPEETQNYVKTTLQRASAGGGAATTTGQPPAPTGGTPQEQQALAGMDQQIDRMKTQIRQFERIGGEEGNKRADNARANLNILVQERNRLETRMLEPTRAAERLEASKQTGAAAAQAKMDEPISPDEAKAYRTGPITRRELVEKFRKGELQPLGPEPTETERSDWRDVADVQSSIQDLRKAMANPKVKQIIGSLWSNPEAFLGRLLSGQVPEAATPEQREYLAQLAETAGVLRTSLLGKAQTPSELKNLIPLLPSGDEPSLAAIEAKLNAIERGAKRRQTTLEKSFKLFRLAGQGTESGEKPGPNVDKMKALIP